MTQVCFTAPAQPAAKHIKVASCWKFNGPLASQCQYRMCGTCPEVFPTIIEHTKQNLGRNPGSGELVVHSPLAYTMHGASLPRCNQTWNIGYMSRHRVRLLKVSTTDKDKGCEASAALKSSPGTQAHKLLVGCCKLLEKQLLVCSISINEHPALRIIRQHMVRRQADHVCHAVIRVQPGLCLQGFVVRVVKGDRISKALAT